jgi:uncharacterized protein YkwD
MPGQKTILALITGGVLAIVLALAPILAWGQRLAPYKTYTRQPPSKGVYYLQDLEKKVFRLTNEARRKEGLSTLAERENLIAKARAYSEDMLRRKFFSHVNPEGLSVKERVVPGYALPISRAGENLWSGTGQDLADKNLLARSIVDSWLLSPGHRENLLHPDYTHMGVGVAVLGLEIRVTQLFVREISR